MAHCPRTASDGAGSALDVAVPAVGAATSSPCGRRNSRSISATRCCCGSIATASGCGRASTGRAASPWVGGTRGRRRSASSPSARSAGGVEALHAVAAALPADFPVPVLIVQHMDPRHKSMLAGLLARRCRLRVKQATHEEDIRGGTIYIAQPDMHLIVRAGRLVLTDTKQV